MLRERVSSDKLSEFVAYLAAIEKNGSGRMPALTELSQELGISVASLREQLEVARALGLVEVRPRTGIRRLPYTFLPAVRQSLAYAMAIDPQSFQSFSDLRIHLEAAYWFQAVNLLTEEDHARLRSIVDSAQKRLNGRPAQVPHTEHRELHLSIYSRLDNPFVTGILEAYWEAYEAIGLNVFTDYAYLQRVWQYHQRMVEAICAGNPEAGYQALVEHVDLLHHRPQSAPKQMFE
jgi:DNA-binding FadR family transcriptional regulator